MSAHASPRSTILSSALKALPLSCMLLALATSGALAQENIIEYTVKKGDTCIRIARKVYGDGDLCYDLMAGSNEFDEKFRIYPGQVLKLPSKEELARQQEARLREEGVLEGPALPSEAAGSPPLEPGAADATLKRFRGDVTARSPEASGWERAERDKDLFRRWRVNSADKSSAEVYFTREKATLRMRENTLVVIYGEATSTSAPSTTRQAVLEKGTLASRLGELSGGSSAPVAEIEIETPSSVVTSKGGDTLVSVVEGDMTLVANHTSKKTKVRGRTKRSKSIDLPENMGTRVEKGKDPEPPKPLPSPPAWEQASLAVSSVGGKSLIKASWDDVPDAAVWRVEVRQTPSEELLDVAVLDARFKEVSFEDFAPGEYALRIATVSNDGFESVMSAPLPLIVSEVLAAYEDPEREQRHVRGDLYVGEELAVRSGLACTFGGVPLTNQRINTAKTGVQELSCIDAAGNKLPPKEFIVSPNAATLERVPTQAMEPDSIEEIRFALEYPIDAIEVTYPEGFASAGEPEQSAAGLWIVPVRAVQPDASGTLRIGTPGILGSTLAEVPLTSTSLEETRLTPEDILRAEKPWHVYLGALVGLEDVTGNGFDFADRLYESDFRGGVRVGAMWRRRLVLEGEFDTGVLIADAPDLSSRQLRQQSFNLLGALSYRLRPARVLRPFVRLGGGAHLVPGLAEVLPRVMGGGGLAIVIGRYGEIRFDVQQSLYLDDGIQIWRTGAFGGFSATF